MPKIEVKLKKENKEFLDFLSTVYITSKGERMNSEELAAYFIKQKLKEHRKSQMDSKSRVAIKGKKKNGNNTKRKTRS